MMTVVYLAGPILVAGCVAFGYWRGWCDAQPARDKRGRFKGKQ